MKAVAQRMSYRVAESDWSDEAIRLSRGLNAPHRLVYRIIEPDRPFMGSRGRRYVNRTTIENGET